MKGRSIAIGAFVVAIVAGVVIWKSKRSDTAATPALTQGSGSGDPTRSRSTATAPDTAPAKLVITVTAAKGPIANATVRLAPDEGDVVIVKTGADGVARADDLAPGTWSISASAADHEPSALPAERLVAGQEAKLAITLVAGGRKLVGTVTDVTGGPVVGARIDAAKLANGSPSRAFATTATGADGRYELTVAEGMLLVGARSADYAAQARYVEVGPAGATADFALVPGGLIEGIVLDARTRQPIARARVGAVVDGGGRRMFGGGGSARFASSGSDGRFRLTGLSPGAYELHARAGTLRTKSPTVVGIGVAEQVSDVELLVGESAVVRGKVVDEANAPVANATVQAMGAGRGEAATSDASGAFELAGLPPGKYAMFARSEQHLPAGMTPLEMKEADVSGVVVKVRAGLTVKGHVEPRQVCEVSTQPADDDDMHRGPVFAAPTTTAADGAFSLGPLAAGKLTVTARCSSGDQGEVAIDLTPQLGDVTVKVTPGASIAGRVVDKDGKPVPGVTVMAAPQGGVERTMIVNGMITSGVKALTNGGGAFELKGLSAGTYRTSVLDRGQPLPLRGTAPKVALAAQEKKTGVEIAVDRAIGKIEGIVTGPDGKPLADAWVSVHQDLEAMLRGMHGPRDDEGTPGGQRMIMVQSDDDEGSSAGQFQPALTDANGKFVIGGLPHGTYHVLAEAQQGKLRGRAENVTPDATLTIQALGLTTLSGTVQGPSGPAALFSVELDGPTRTQRSFTNGVFELGRVDPGSYTLRVRSSDGNAEQKIVVDAGAPTKVAIVLVANAVVIGRIVDGAGKPLEGMPVAVIDDAGDGGVRIALEGPPPTSGPDGKFRVEHKAGPSILVVMAPPRPVTKPGLALEAGKTFDVGDVRVERAPPPAP